MNVPNFREGRRSCPRPGRRAKAKDACLPLHRQVSPWYGAYSGLILPVAPTHLEGRCYSAFQGLSTPELGQKP